MLFLLGTIIRGKWSHFVLPWYVTTDRCHNWLIKVLFFYPESICQSKKSAFYANYILGRLLIVTLLLVCITIVKYFKTLLVVIIGHNNFHKKHVSTTDSEDQLSAILIGRCDGNEGKTKITKFLSKHTKWHMSCWLLQKTVGCN